MNTLIALVADPVLAVLAAFVQPLLGVVLGVSDTIGGDLADTIRKIVGPLVILGVGLVALSYLMRRQVTQFLQFIALAVLIGVFFYTNALIAVVEFVAGLFGGDTVGPTNA